MPAAPPATSPAAWRGPLRAAIAIFVVGFLVVWLVKPIGNPCPDLGSLPVGSTASSSPSFSPPGSRTCTYAAGGVQATAKYMPWLDWIVLLLIAALTAGAVRALSPGSRAPRAAGAAGGSRSKRSHASRFERDPRPAGARAEGRPRAAPPPPADPSAGRTAERDAAERERARAERAARRSR